MLHIIHLPAHDNKFASMLLLLMLICCR